jgi:hypothetical protein
MSISTTPPRVEGSDVVVLQTPTLQWALKRALLGVVILFVTVALAATLLYASIEPDAADLDPLRGSLGSHTTGVEPVASDLAIRI